MLQGGTEIVMLTRNSTIRDTFVKGHPLEGINYYSLHLFDKTHHLSLYQTYIHDMQDILQMPIYSYEAICVIELQEPSGENTRGDNGFALNLKHMYYLVFLEHMLNHIAPTQVA